VNGLTKKSIIMTLLCTKPLLRNGYPAGSLSEPSMNVLEREDAWVLELAAPGLEKEDFELEVAEGRLHIRAKKDMAPGEQETFLRREFGGYDFEKTFRLSEKVEAEGISASYEAGILRLTLPKAENAKPRKVDIQ
jgi:HSP20 family protein